MVAVFSHIFTELIQKYQTWDDLRSYLESEAGGSFRVVDKNDEAGLVVIRYEKGTSIMNLPHSKWFRSVVWNTRLNRPVSIAPPKTTTEPLPYKTFDELQEANVVCQEFLDGFMINCFKMNDGELHITSRSKLDAAGKFYSDNTFRELFNEAFLNTGLVERDLVPPSEGQIATFYCFLVQHNQHRIVKNITENRVWIIQSGIVFEDGRFQSTDSPQLGKATMPEINLPLASKASYARAVAGEDYETPVEKCIKDIIQEHSWDFQGVVLKDQDGNRWRFRSDKYLAVKSLRGNSSKAYERFSQLYCQNLVHKYLEYYPEEMMLMTVHLMIMNSLIKTVYDLYVDLHITKVRKIEEIDKMFYPHLYNIHGLFLSQLRPAGKRINLSEIQVYFHKQPWQRIAFLIRKLQEMSDTNVE